MKVLYYCPWDGTFMSEWQKVQIFEELEHYGIHIDIFNPRDYKSYDEANEVLLKLLKTNVDKYDLFLNCASSEMLFDDTMKVMASMPIPKLLICFDNLHGPYMHRKIAPYFDLVWLTSWETEPMFKSWGCKTLFQPYASNPFFFKDKYIEGIDKVCFVGTPYGTRSVMFNNLVQGGIDVDVFCKKSNTELHTSNTIATNHNSFATNLKVIKDLVTFPIGRKVIYSGIKAKVFGTTSLFESEHLTKLNQLSYEEMNRAYSNYALSLNVITLRNTAVLKHPVHKLHLRTFEIPMCGGLELVEYNEELSRYFSVQEIVFYRDKEEMVDKAKFYTNPKNENVCRQMKLNARRRAANEHSWMNRFSKAFDVLGLKYNNKSDISI